MLEKRKTEDPGHMCHNDDEVKNLKITISLHSLFANPHPEIRSCESLNTIYFGRLYENVQ